MSGHFVRAIAVPFPARRPFFTVFLAARLHVDLLRMSSALCRA